MPGKSYRFRSFLTSAVTTPRSSAISCTGPRLRVDRFEESGAGASSPASVGGGLGWHQDLPVAKKADEMIEPQRVETFEGGTQSVQSPPKAVLKAKRSRGSR